MQRPATLCHLKKDLMIDAQENFVDTFNWIVDFVNNIRGDGDDDKNKKITVDKTTSDFPIIKFSDDGDIAGSVTVEGTDGVSVEGVTTIKFSSAPDTNIKATVTKDGDVANVTIGVYYK